MGTVNLQFKTQNTAVTFVLPTGRESATVAGGEATGTWGHDVVGERCRHDQGRGV